MLEVREHSSPSYAPRTYYNAAMGSITLAIAVDMSTAGERLTKKAAKERYFGVELNKREITVLRLRDISRELYKVLPKTNCTLNIAGNGIYTLSKHDISQAEINQIVYDIVSLVHKHKPILKIYTGGQTGVDIAGAVTGVALGIETIVTLPKGCRQRFEDGKDIESNIHAIENQINNWVKILTL